MFFDKKLGQFSPVPVVDAEQIIARLDAACVRDVGILMDGTDPGGHHKATIDALVPQLLVRGFRVWGHSPTRVPRLSDRNGGTDVQVRNQADLIRRSPTVWKLLRAVDGVIVVGGGGTYRTLIGQTRKRVRITLHKEKASYAFDC